MQTFYEGHAVLEKVDFAGIDNVYALYLVRDVDPTRGTETYRVYSKYGRRSFPELQATNKKLGIDSLFAALAFFENDIVRKFDDGFYGVNYSGRAKELLERFAVSKPRPPVDSGTLNPILHGARDDRRGLVHPESLRFSKTKDDGFDWERDMTLVLDAPQAGNPLPLDIVVPQPNMTRAQVVVDRTHKAIASAKSMLRELCKDHPSPFSSTSPDQDYIPVCNHHIWTGEQQIRQMAYLWETNSRVLSVGPAGCGKTELFLDMAATLGRPFLRINLNGHVTPSEIIGKYVARDGQTIWLDGALPMCMKRGYNLLVDEIDHGSPDITSIFHPVLEPDGELVLKEHESEVIRPHPEFRMYATANSLGTHDEPGIYTGTNCMNAAFLDRWEILVANYPTVKIETAILCMKGHVYSVAAGLAEGAASVRNAIKKGEITGVLSTRRLIKLAAAFKKFDSFAWALGISLEGQYSVAEASTVASTLKRFVRKSYSVMPIT